MFNMRKWPHLAPYIIVTSPVQCTEMGFISFSFGGFTTLAIFCESSGRKTGKLRLCVVRYLLLWVQHST